MRYLLSLLLFIVPEIVFAQQSLDTLWVRVIRKLDGTTVKILDTLEFPDGTKMATAAVGGSVDSANFQKYQDTLTFDFTRTQFNTEILKYVAKSDTATWLPTWADILAKNYLVPSDTNLVVKRPDTSWIATKQYANSLVITDHGALTGLSDNDHPQYVLGADTTSWVPTWADILVLNYLKASDTTWIGTQYRLWSGQTANYLPYWTGTRYEKSPIKRSGNDSTEFGTSATSNTHTLYMGDNGKVRIARHASQYMDFQSTSSYHSLLAYGTKDFVIGTASANTLQFFTKNVMRGKIDTLGTLLWQASLYLGTGTLPAGIVNMINNYNSNVGLVLKPTSTGGGRAIVVKTSADADVFEVSAAGAITAASLSINSKGPALYSGSPAEGQILKWTSGAWALRADSTGTASGVADGQNADSLNGKILDTLNRDLGSGKYTVPAYNPDSTKYKHFQLVGFDSTGLSIGDSTACVLSVQANKIVITRQKNRSGSAAFTTTGQRVAVYIPGAKSTDRYFLQTYIAGTTPPTAVDTRMGVTAKTDSLIVLRPASGTSGQTFYWWRVP